MAQITPAYVPSEVKSDFTTGYKSLTGAFRKISSYYFTGARIFRNEKERVKVVRLQFYNEREGSYISSPRMYANYAYQIPISGNTCFFAGLALGMTGVYYSAPTTTQSSFFLPDGAAGLGIKSNWFELGTSTMQIFDATFHPIQSVITLKRYYHMYSTLQKEWPSGWKWKGYLLWRSMPSYTDEYFAATSVSYAQHLTLGVSMKYDAAISFFTIFGIDGNEDRIQLMLNYNSAFFSLVPAYQSNLEIGLNYAIQ